MKPTIKVSESGSGTADLKARLGQIRKSQVLVGWPESGPSRKGGAITNPELVYILSNGSPLRGIPATPILEPAIQLPEAKAAITTELKQAAAAYLDKQPGQAQRHLERAGMAGRNAAISYFTDPRNNWPANSPLTIARKGSDRRNIDKGELRRDVQYIVETK